MLAMKIEGIDVEKTIATAKDELSKSKGVPDSFKHVFSVVLMLLEILLIRICLNSATSSKPPSSDPNRKKERKSSGKKRGGQKGHKFKTLEPVEDPDEIKNLKLDRRTLPKGHYKEVGYIPRQLLDIEVRTVVTEYRAQQLEDEDGKVYTAEFPAHVKRPIQYGPTLKAHAVYMSKFQLIPYERIQEYFQDQLGVSLSRGTLHNFNIEVYENLKECEEIIKSTLQNSELVHFDETGINVDSERYWLHTACNEHFTFLYPHAKRGYEATEDMGILPVFTGVAVHDNWGTYFQYEHCKHSLCNAHHIRELESVEKNYKHEWGLHMQNLLCEIRQEVENSRDSYLGAERINIHKKRYNEILDQAEKQCPLAPPSLKRPNSRGKQTKPRNLLDRLRDRQDSVLMFMEVSYVPFTNNTGERAIRMTKVHQKISGCFRDIKGAYIFCRTRGYIDTCRKNNVSATQALRCIIMDEMPEFCSVLGMK